MKIFDKKTLKKEFVVMNDIQLVHLCQIAREKKASDLHLNVGLPPMLRISGNLIKINLPVLTADINYRLIYSILTDRQKSIYEQKKQLNFVFSLEKLGRFRGNIFFKEGGHSGVFRIVENTIRSLTEINLENIISKLFDSLRGLILITGAGGSGKTSTINSLIDYVNTNISAHIMTIEDPIEYLHPHKKSIISQREIGMHSLSFQDALHNAIRSDVNVIFIGQITDIDTMKTVLTATETGFLVLSTLSTCGAIETITRIIDMFRGDEKNEARVQISLSLKAIISQQLLTSSNDQNIRLCASEVLFNTKAIANLIREGDMNQLEHIIDTNKEKGMISMKRSIKNLIENNLISKESIKEFE